MKTIFIIVLMIGAAIQLYLSCNMKRKYESEIDRLQLIIDQEGRAKWNH